MSGVLRRGSLNFDCNGKSNRGSIESNLYGGYRDSKPRTPEISVIALDFRRYSEDLKKDVLKLPETSQNFIGNNKEKNNEDEESDVISDLIGHIGKWQLIWTITLCLFQIPPTLHMFTFVFQTAEKDFWCARPTDMLDMNATTWKNLTQPNGDSCTILDSDDYFTLLTLAAEDNTSYTNCKNFEFYHAEGDTSVTLVEEFNLVCGRRNLLSVVEMCFLAGAAIGSVSSGWISDRFGRKHTLMCFASIQAIFGTILAFSTSLSMYMTLRVIMGFASMTVTVVSFVLVVELVSGKWRTIIGILNIVPVALTYVLTAGIAYFVRDWRTLQLIISLPWLAIISIWYCMPESPRWLLARGQLKDLYAIIERAARMNRRILPVNYQKSVEAAAPATVHSTAKMQATMENANTSVSEASKDSRSTVTNSIDGNTNPLVVVFGKLYRRTTCLTLIIWLTLIIIYFGLTLHLSNLGGNIYMNTAIAGIVEAISICVGLVIVLKFGLRRNLIAYMLIPGICCLATNIVPQGDDNLKWVITLAMIAKCVIGANNAIIPTYTAMQYPTVVRNFGVGLGNLAAGVGLVLVPYMWLLEHVDPLLPMSIMGVCGLIGAVTLMLMKDVQK
ncbi:organic cation transporter protein [Teleopsis dalmanni]|uniref:organic cation transporter protein n=1 Tax=Teleopsis dalmanni TaxID=139649 RepID=UPI0018CD09B5|nr:organic cation transporter protein [Teleopsis dalmanni]